MKNVLGNVKGSAIPEHVKILGIMRQGELAVTHVLNVLSQLRDLTPFRHISALLDPPSTVLLPYLQPLTRSSFH